MPLQQRNVFDHGPYRVNMLGAGALLIFLAGCDRESTRRQNAHAAAVTPTDSMGVAASNVRIIPVNAPRSLKENSTAVITPAQPAIVFTINDSGNEPELFALDTTGATRGVWRVSGASNVDWEAMSHGPCANFVGQPLSARKCLYIADTGDNHALRSTVQMYRVAEPEAKHDRSEGLLPAEKISFAYPDSPHDVEAVYTTRTGDTYLITKRKLKDAQKRLRPALVFLVPFSAWQSHKNFIAPLVDSLPVVPGSSRLREITDASLSHDSHYLAVRTYSQVYVFRVDSASGRVDHRVAPALCDLQNVERVPGEGIAWVGVDHELLLDSEGRETPMHRITCPLPH